MRGVERGVGVELTWRCRCDGWGVLLVAQVSTTPGLDLGSRQSARPH
jgi:hypothetical protein